MLNLKKDINVIKRWHVSRRKQVHTVGAKLQEGDSGTLKMNFVRFIAELKFSNEITV